LDCRRGRPPIESFGTRRQSDHRRLEQTLSLMQLRFLQAHCVAFQRAKQHFDAPEKPTEPNDFARRIGIANRDAGQKRGPGGGASFTGGLIWQASTSVFDTVSGSVLAKP
jgi:hypothetical protein